MPEIVGVVHSLVIRVVLHSITPYLNASHHFDFPVTTSPVPPLLVRRTRVKVGAGTGPEQPPSGAGATRRVYVTDSPVLLLLVVVLLLYRVLMN